MSEEVAKLYRVRKTVCAMLEARGYLVSQADAKITLDEFRDKFDEQNM